MSHVEGSPTVEDTVDTPTVNTDLGNVVTNKVARRLVYGGYVVATVVVGGVSAYFLGTGHALPEPIIGAQAVITFLGIPVGGLALANTGK